MFSLNFMFFCSIIEELGTKEENYKTSCNFNFGHECILSDLGAHPYNLIIKGLHDAPKVALVLFFIKIFIV